MTRTEFGHIFRLFLIWLISFFALYFFTSRFFPLQKNFLGGGYDNYLKAPFFWFWSNFDGQHYISIAENGYGFGERAFFPLYPLLIKIVSGLFGSGLVALNLAGILISCVSFFVGIVGFYKLLKIDFSTKFVNIVILFLLVFPTSFYFASVYTESLFFALSVWGFYFARKGHWFLASVLGIFLTLTRFVGLIILPAFLIEWILQNYKKRKFISIFPEIILTIPTGLLAYMFYLERTIHNMFAFYSDLSVFGEQRSSHLIVLPQVFYRYVFKIFPNLNIYFFPVIFTTFFEFFIGVVYLFFSIFAFFKIRLSYAVYLFLGYIIPTFSGSFSSLPRYVLILFPAYILFTVYLQKKRVLLFAFLIISFILLIISFSLFSRGYWIS